MTNQKHINTRKQRYCIRTRKKMFTTQAYLDNKGASQKLLANWQASEKEDGEDGK